MKKFLFFFVFTFTVISLKAQLDTDHWFAPMAAANSGTLRNFTSNLYLSTNETTPFRVDVYNNNKFFTTVQLVKGNPQKIQIPEEFMVTVNPIEILTPTSKGLYVKGTKKFFANYRFSVLNHAEIITSKGLAGIGTEFYAAMAPISGTAEYVNATIGILATEDNTEVSISNYDSDVVFSNGNTDDDLKVILNKGQSYIIDANSVREQANQAGLIGTHIVSNHPISVTNGNFNGIYTWNNFTNNDILMDQAVPVNRLGNDFAIIKGNGDITSGMEAVLLVATEDNTDVFVNGATTPIITLNKGENYTIQSTEYVSHGMGNYNIGIKTSKNLYVYQLLGGTSSGSIYATGGFNYIPPLNCFLPSKVDEIGYINEIGYDYYNTKLNILSQKGGIITVNGSSLNPSNGPFPVAGNPDWETYSVPNVSGNITVNSTKSVTAGIAAGNGAVGYGGYFAGFSSIPSITKTGDCFSGTLLQVDDSYDTYQWYFNGAPIPGATTYFINPEILGSGTYTCQISKNLCGSETTKPYDYTLCPPIANIPFSIGSCEEINIPPKFTTSTQTLVPNNSRIIVNPVFGTVTIDPATGLVNYKVNSNLTQDEEDMFVFYVEGNGDPADFEYFRVNVKIDFLKVQNATLKSCSDATGKGIFNLESAFVTQEVDTKIAYFQDPNFNLPITNPTAYSSQTTAVYAKITSVYGCIATSKIDLEVVPSPNIDTSKLNPINCDDDFDGKVNIDFNLVTSQIVNQSDYFNVQYYLSSSDAQNGNTSTLPTNWSYTAPTTVYVRVDSKGANCTPAFGEIHFDFKSRTSLVSNSIIQPVCDSDLNGSETYDFKSALSLLSTSPTLSSSIFKTELEAQKNTNPISNPTVKDGEIYYLRVSDVINCANIAAVKIQMKSSRKSEILVDQTICPESKTVLDAGSGYDYYHWSTGEEGTALSQIQVAPGNYWVDLTSNGCVYRQEVHVFAAELPTIESIEIKGNTATIVTKGGTPPLQYSLDKVEWFTSPTFKNLERGIHTVYVKSKDNCSPTSKEFLIINLINIITPNDDGKNDVLDYSDLRIKKDVHIRVFDRYGVIQYDSPSDNYIWDGKRNGRPLATGTYWYTIQWIEPDTNLPVTYSNWILLKNRD